MINLEQVIGIGIEKITMAKEMMKLIRTVDNNEDVIFILETILNELQNGLDEIDKLSINQ